MIDEKLLHDRLNDAAGAQDDLLPRALADDLTAGRRRLRRHRLLTGATALVAAGVVVAATVGVGGVLRNAGPDEAPAATQQTAADAADAARVAEVQGFDTLMKGLIVKNLDPGAKHLDFSPGPFEIDGQVGYHGTLHKVGWKVAGDKGEGVLLIGLSRSQKAADNVCGSYFEPKMICHSTTLPNGRPAMVARQGQQVELSYVQPDGEFAYVAMDPLFGNNTTVPLKNMAITDAQLIAFVTDPELNLPPLSAEEQAQENQLKDFAPTPDQAEAAATQRLSGTLRRTDLGDYPGQLSLVENWTKGSVSASVEITVTAAPMAADCTNLLSVPTCDPVTLPNGAKGEYHAGARTYQNGPFYVTGVTYVQPDGDVVSIRALYPGKTLPAGAITKAQLLALVTDPALDR